MKTRKKLIEVALPLEAINKAAAREKSIRHGQSEIEYRHYEMKATFAAWHLSCILFCWRGAIALAPSLAYNCAIPDDLIRLDL